MCYMDIKNMVSCSQFEGMSLQHGIIISNWTLKTQEKSFSQYLCLHSRGWRRNILAHVIFLAQVEQLADLVGSLGPPQSWLLLICQAWQCALTWTEQQWSVSAKVYEAFVLPCMHFHCQKLWTQNLWAHLCWWALISDSPGTTDWSQYEIWQCSLSDSVYNSAHRSALWCKSCASVKMDTVLSDSCSR